MKKKPEVVPVEIVLGGTAIRLEPLGAEAGIQLCLLIGPYLPKLGEIWDALEQDEDVDLQVESLRILAQAMEAFPGDLIRMVGLLVERRPEWIAQNATASELFDALKILIRTYELWTIIKLGFSLGLIKEGMEQWLKKEQNP